MPTSNDVRPRLAEAFRALRAGEGPVWVTWEGKRLLLGLPDEAWLADPRGPAVIATARGYRKVVLVGRAAEGGFRHTKRGVPKQQPLRSQRDYFAPIAPKRLRAVILEEHDR